MGREWPRALLHCDLDAFFAAVEQLDFPELRGKPVIVGGEPGTRSVVCAASYEAKRRGVKTAVPVRQAAALCPDAVFRKPRYERYLELSQRMMDIFRSYTPLVEPVSIDEAFLDVTGSQRMFGSPPAMAEEIKARVLDEVGLTVSIGVASCKFVAKVASAADKPDGLVVVEPGMEREFLAPLPVSDMWGVGSATEAALREMGIRTIGQLAAASPSLLVRKLGKPGRQLYLLANAIDFREVESGVAPRSIGNSLTLERDTTDVETLAARLRYLAHKVGFRMRRAGLAASSVVLKCRWADMRSFSRRKRLPFPSDLDDDIFHAALELLRSQPMLHPVRKLGITAAELERAQDPFLLDEAQRRRRLDRAVDLIERRYGRGAVRRAVEVPPDARAREPHPFMFLERVKGRDRPLPQGGEDDIIR